MGTYTDFTGAIRITPCLKEPLAGRFRQFLGIRHMKRDVKILEALFPTLEERKAVTLFGDGDFGEDGAFFLPIHTRDLTRRICLHERYAEGLTDERDMNMTPGPCPSLYCDLELRNDPDNGHSYLGWNEAEKAYYITDWIGYIAEWLSKLGYHLDGKMFAVVEGGMSYYTITVDGDKVTSEEFIPDATYGSSDPVIVGRYINGISLNGLEYLKNDADEVIYFAGVEAAKVYLREHGVTEDEMEDMVFRKSVGTCFRCGDPLFLSDIPEYTCQCFRCDEDFYSIEQDVDL